MILVFIGGKPVAEISADFKARLFYHGSASFEFLGPNGPDRMLLKRNGTDWQATTYSHGLTTSVEFREYPENTTIVVKVRDGTLTSECTFAKEICKWSAGTRHFPTWDAYMWALDLVRNENELAEKLLSQGLYN